MIPQVHDFQTGIGISSNSRNLTAALILFVAGVCGCSENAPEKTRVQHESQTAVADDQSGHQRMLDQLRQIEELTSESNPYLGDKESRHLQKELTAAIRSGNKAKEWLQLVKLGRAELRLGHEHDGILYLSQAAEMIPVVRDRIGPQRVAETFFQLGVAYLRLGESQNCCQQHTPDSCILPIRGGGIHTNREGSTNAIKHLSRVLEITPSTETRHKQSRWLLNLAYMTLGDYPDQVPEDYRIPETAFTSNIDFPRFINIAADTGLDTFDLSGGVVLDDFNGDHYLDVFTSC